MAPIPDINNKYFSPQEIDEMIEYQGINVGVILAKRIWKNYNKDIPILFFSAKSSPIVEYPELKKYKCDFLMCYPVFFYIGKILGLLFLYAR